MGTTYCEKVFERDFLESKKLKFDVKTGSFRSINFSEQCQGNVFFDGNKPTNG